jgi:CheY-like chemotaxis protein
LVRQRLPAQQAFQACEREHNDQAEHQLYWHRNVYLRACVRELNDDVAIVGFSAQEGLQPNSYDVRQSAISLHQWLGFPRAGYISARMPSRRVLVVEDNLDTVHTLVALLKTEGHRVEYAINGYAAMSIARKFLPEVVILDLGLPGLDGFEVCARLKQEPQFKGTKFIAVSGYFKEEDQVRSRAAGCDHHLPKPADPKQLLALVAA